MHTPGPWIHGHTDDDSLYKVWARFDTPDEEEVADVFATHDGTSDANARLIAAAPEMLALLKERIGPHAPPYMQWVARVSTLLARLEG